MRDLEENENFFKRKTIVITEAIEASFVCPNFAFKGRWSSPSQFLFSLIAAGIYMLSWREYFTLTFNNLLVKNMHLHANTQNVNKFFSKCASTWWKSVIALNATTVDNFHASIFQMKTSRIHKPWDTEFILNDIFESESNLPYKSLAASPLNEKAKKVHKWTRQTWQFLRKVDADYFYICDPLF